jgi:hypothetical protein
MITSWDTAAERTKRHYIRKAKQIVFATLEEIARFGFSLLLNLYITLSTLLTTIPYCLFLFD